MSDKVRYAELRPREFRERLAQRPLALPPLGTLEGHGEQLPLGSDAIISEGVWKSQIDHAARNKTSLVMALRPGLVDLGALDADREAGNIHAT